MPGNGRNGTRRAEIAGERNGAAAGPKDGQGRERGAGGVTTSVGGWKRGRPGSVAGREAGKMLQVQEGRRGGEGEIPQEEGRPGGEGKETGRGRGSLERQGAAQSRPSQGNRPAHAARRAEADQARKSRGKPRPAAVLTSGGSRNRSRKPLRRRPYRGGASHFREADRHRKGAQYFPLHTSKTPPNSPKNPLKSPPNPPQCTQQFPHLCKRRNTTVW